MDGNETNGHITKKGWTVRKEKQGEYSEGDLENVRHDGRRRAFFRVYPNTRFDLWCPIDGMGYYAVL